MYTAYRTNGIQTWFVIGGLDAAYCDIVRRLGFEPVDDGFARHFATSGPHMEPIFSHFAAVAEEWILQKAGVRPVPWETVLERMIHLLNKHQLTWWLVGSAALAVRGLPVVPHDIDLVVEEPAAFQLGELLRNELIEPVQPITTWRARWYGRAFSGACIEWVGGVPAEHAWSATSSWERVIWRGALLRIPPLSNTA